jgi:hypothetical protein
LIYTVVVGRFTVTDFFDNNRYTHDPRTQFMGWGIMYNGAWDYPADTRGYTWGWVHEFHTRRWSLRYGSAAEPKVANGMRFDRRLFRDRSDMFEGELRYRPGGHAGAIRFVSFLNRSNSGTYADALQLARENGSIPDITATRRVGTLKYGFGLNLEQEITKNIGIFARLGWNDGKTESFAFTAIDRLASGGISVTGEKWKRPFDTVATGLTVSGLSAVHAAYQLMVARISSSATGRFDIDRSTSLKRTTALASFPVFLRRWICNAWSILRTTATVVRYGFPRSDYMWN